MSKFMETQKKIEKAVVSGYQKIEDTVVSGYKKIEAGAVSGYQKIENKFVEAFLPDHISPGAGEPDTTRKEEEAKAATEAE